MNDFSKIKVFAGSASVELANKICGVLGVEVRPGEKITFSEGNIYVKIGEKVRGEDVYIVQTIGLDPNNEFMELLFWLDAFKRTNVNSVTAIIPYFSYAKADKKDEPRVSIRARVCADCLEAAGVDRVVTMDLHSPQIQGFFKKPVDHLYAAGIFGDAIRAMGLQDYVIVAPDEGFAKKARYYANLLSVPLVIGNKQRLYHDENAEVLGIMGDVDGLDAVIVDDFTISCGTVAEVAKALKARGARDIYAYISHGLMSETGIRRLNESPIKKLFTTDTVYNPRAEKCEKVSVITASKLFARAIKAIHSHESLSALFE
ncbi:MAG: ribose-phosphate diphosphokinase [Firmicutes bacterium]|nr:ribose-phosphate diphosphokinase [Bacillota bacterium]